MTVGNNWKLTAGTAPSFLPWINIHLLEFLQKVFWISGEETLNLTKPHKPTHKQTHCTYTQARTCAHTHTHTHTHTHVHRDTHTQKHTQIYKRTHRHTHTVAPHTHTQAHRDTHIQNHTQIHTHRHTLRSDSRESMRDMNMKFNITRAGRYSCSPSLSNLEFNYLTYNFIHSYCENVCDFYPLPTKIFSKIPIYLQLTIR